MNIKAIMCDIDGTLLGETGYISDNNIEAIKRVKETGILFGLCTGRDVKNVISALKRWHIDGLVDCIIGSGGGELYDANLNLNKVSYQLKQEHVKEIMEHYKDMDINFCIPYDGVLYAPKEDRHIKMLALADHEPYKILPLEELILLPLLKFMIICDPEYMEHVIARSKTFERDEYKSMALVTASVLFEYMDPRISKANGLRELLSLHHIKMSELCTFGDADNDYDMTREAGLGIVMENGTKRTKDVADFITLSCEEDGVAHYINNYILK